MECGTAYGGSAAYLAAICDLIGKGTVLTIDLKQMENRPAHQRIKYIQGNSVSADVLQQVQKHVQAKSVIVILDSDHHKEHVLKELEQYSKFVSLGSYLIVEDAIVNGHPVLGSYGDGPWEAIDEFLDQNKNFVVDKTKEKFMLTFNPKGYLKKIH